MHPRKSGPAAPRSHAGLPLPGHQFACPLPYGAILRDDGVQFVVYSRSATGMRVLLYDGVADTEPAASIDLDPEAHRWGDIWSLLVPGLAPGQLYHLQAAGPFAPETGQRFDGRARLIDPYAKALAGGFLVAADGTLVPPKCVVVDDAFDWRGDRHLRRPLADTVIYELHVRGFTADPSSGVAAPGTYLGVIEKIPYLRRLGVTAVELMPVHEFPVTAIPPLEGPANYWGYDPLAFFAPHRGYAAGSEPGCQVREFKEMVRALHAAGIEVILDVVFNHTAEGNHIGPTLSFKGLENRVYYMLEGGGARYRNYSGCGNTVNGNHPVVREMIFLCLRHWVHEYHVDGFRFDLASILSRDRDGEILPNPPVVELITEDPLLADTKIIAEAWDAAGAYQVGSFAGLRWAEWNGRYRDDVRRYWRGDHAQTGHLATRFAGSSDLYASGARQPYHSINFVTSHDGFTLSDLVTYREKHNQANGEGNRDGDDNSFSDNYGTEGPTTEPGLVALRSRQVRNFLATLLLSQGVPMLVAGDECRRTQQGNNNPWCQDNPLSWFDWSLVDRHADLVRFVAEVVRFRLANPALRRRGFLRGSAAAGDRFADVEWFSPAGGPVDWAAGDAGLVAWLTTAVAPGESRGAGLPRHVLVLFHAGSAPRDFVLPRAEVVRGLPWRLFIDTRAPSPADVWEDGRGPLVPPEEVFALPGRALVCLVADPVPEALPRIGSDPGAPVSSH